MLVGYSVLVAELTVHTFPCTTSCPATYDDNHGCLMKESWSELLLEGSGMETHTMSVDDITDV